MGPSQPGPGICPEVEEQIPSNFTYVFEIRVGVSGGLISLS